MKKILTIAFLQLALFSQAKQVLRLSDYVNPMIGASTSVGAAGVYHGLGKTYPGATTPFGMVQVSPNTITGGDNGSGYSDEHRSIEGFAFTQMSGIGWYGDLGNLLVTPATGNLQTSAGSMEHPEEGYRSCYDKSSELAKAGYYSVMLTDVNIRTEATATPHAGLLRFTFPENKRSRIQLDLARRVGGTSNRQYVQVVNENTIQGWMECTPDGGGWGNGAGSARYTVYFYAQFSKPLKQFGVWSADIPDGLSRKLEDVVSPAYQKRIAEATIHQGVREFEGKHLGFFSDFETKAGEQVLFKSGISFVSMEGARKNLSQEITDWNFDRVLENSRKQWDKALACMQVKTNNQTSKTIFYTSLYHTMLDPRIATDVDGKYTGGDQQVHQSQAFTKRTIFSGWDVFRSQMPLQTIVHPALISDLLNSLITLADESGKGYFERWEFFNAYSGCMLGNPAISVLADAWAKGIRSYDVEKAYRYAIKSSEKFGNAPKGYSPGSTGISYTLEYAYTEWCVAQMAKALGHAQDARDYSKLALSYQNIYDSEKGSFRPRMNDGRFEEWPKEGRLKEWYGCMECNPYQQGWFVPHDVEGMTRLMGGKERVLADLDTFFLKTPKNFQWNNYYNHANEPVHHVPFLYNRLGQPWKTQYQTRFICENAYKDAVEGLVGNEDVGQMSAWYVLASSGIHPICPGDTRFEITSPQFDEICIQVGKGKTFIIRAKNNGPQAVYILSAKLNGKKYSKSHLDYSDIVKGGVLELVMGVVPNQKWGLEN